MLSKVKWLRAFKCSFYHTLAWLINNALYTDQNPVLIFRRAGCRTPAITPFC